MSILLSEQKLNFASEIVDRAYILEKGTIQYSGPFDTNLKDDAIRQKYLAI